MIRRTMLQAFQATAAVPKNIQLFFIGDSITRGIGTTGSSFAGQGGVYGGANSYPQQVLVGLTGLNATVMQRGWSGETILWYNTNDLDRTIAMFDKVNYTDIYCVLYFGTNDMSLEAGNRTAVEFQSDITALSAAFKAAGAKTIIVPPLDVQTSSRNDVAYNASRMAFNTWLLANYATIANGVADTSAYPDIYNIGAASNTTYFASVAADPSGAGALHPTDAGAVMIAAAIISAVNTLSTTASLPITPVDEAANFIAAADITDATTIAAIESMVTSLKAAKLWWKLRCIYPFVGGTADTCKYNLRDTNLNTLTYVGTPIFDNTGITWVSGSYADTSFIQIPSSDFENSNSSLHYYSRSNIAAGIDIGAFDSNGVCWLGLNTTGDGVHSQINVYAGANSLPYSNYTGLFSACRADSAFTADTLYRHGVKELVVNETVSTNGPLVSATIGIDNPHFSHPSPRNCAYAAIGYGLTAAEEVEHYTIIQAFQTTLGREI
jgi:lysophospholipase L1-like esterase